MRKFLSLALAIVMVLSLTLVAAGAADNTATVSIYDINGNLVEKNTYQVGETVVATVCLNTSKISTIAALKAEQGYTSSVLALQGAEFPVTDAGTVANLNLDSRISYNASTPQLDPDGFKFNSDDSKLIVSTYKVTAAGTASITNTFVTLAIADYTMTKIIDQGTVKNNNFTMSYDLSDPAPVEGGNVTGTVTSFLTGDAVTVQLIKGETVVKEAQVTGPTETKSSGVVTETADFAFNGVDGGSYILRFSKENHVTRDYDIVVNGNFEMNDAKIAPPGDVNMNGEITTMDVTMANSHVKKVTTLTSYAFLVADALPSTEGITTLDVTRINSHVKKVKPLW